MSRRGFFHRSQFYIWTMFRISGDHLTDLLARADVSQAAFARLAGVTARQVNNWCRDRAVVPSWAAVLAGVLQEQSPEALTILVEEQLARAPVAPTGEARKDHSGNRHG
jgi:DNA-binding transcriptional regulator YiaG